MKKAKDKELDNLFKKRLEDPVNEAGFLEDDWNALEQMLDEPKKRRGIVFWLPILSSAAAFLIFFGWWFFTPKIAPHHSQKKQVAVVHEQKDADLSRGRGQVKQNTIKSEDKGLALVYNNSHGQPVSHETAVRNAGSGTKKELAANHNTKQAGNLQSNKNSQDKQGGMQLQAKDYNTRQANNLHGSKNSQDKQYNRQQPSQAKNNNTYNAAIIPNNVKREGITLMAVNAGIMENGDMITNRQPVTADDRVLKGAGNASIYANKKDKITTKLGFVRHPQMALTVLGAPELNSVNSVQGSKSGTNLGLLFSIGVFNKITVSTGAAYSSKPYNTDIANYHTAYTFKTNPTSIEANCRVLDIPLNVDYQLYNKHQNKFSVGTGLSSYIMLHESYNYYYADPATKGPVAYTVPHSGKYFFGVANIQATYTRQVNSKVGLSIQPYMKLPLTNIGYSQAKLQTLGVAVGVNWNLNSLTKP